jgi:hypothetical protein
MIAFARKQRSRASTRSAWQAGFLEMLPAIHAQLRFAFRDLRPEERAEAMADATANAAVVYARLHQLGKVDVAYPSALARFAVAQYRSGRRVGASLNVNDVTSCHAQRRHSLRVERLDRQDAEAGWREILVEDRGCTPAELAASRIDFAAWLRRLPLKRRRIAKTLALGETTQRAAQRFRLSPGRISQLRRELNADWLDFHREPVCSEPLHRT